MPGMFASSRVRVAETDAVLRRRLTGAERERLETLERENRELCRASETLESDAAFFGSEFDRRPKR